MRIVALYLTTIICGFCMMALEIVGARALFPSFGSSVDVWAAIISVFILSFSIGYVLGGIIADRMKSNLPLAWVIGGAGLLYCLLPIYALTFTEGLGEQIHTAKWGVLLAALVLFLPPSLLLGSVSPVLVKLAFVDAERVGRTTGTLYAVGSVGNFAGILAADYILLPLVTLNDAIWGMGVILCLLAVCHLVVRMHARIPGTTAPQVPA
jgi:hypothetical protein